MDDLIKELKELIEKWSQNPRAIDCVEDLKRLLKLCEEA